MLARSNNQEYQRSIVNTLVFFLFVLFLDSVTGQNNFNIVNLV